MDPLPSNSPEGSLLLGPGFTGFRSRWQRLALMLPGLRRALALDGRSDALGAGVGGLRSLGWGVEWMETLDRQWVRRSEGDVVEIGRSALGSAAHWLDLVLDPRYDAWQSYRLDVFVVIVITL